MTGLNLAPSATFDIDVSTAGTAVNTAGLSLNNLTNSTVDGLDLTDPVVGAPDIGYAKTARRYATRLGAPLAVADAPAI